MKCITCESDFDPKTNKPEHILLNSLGGKATTKRVICGECNSSYGKVIDRGFAESVAMIRCLGILRSGDGRLPPTLKGVSLESGESIDLLPGFVPVQNSFVFETQEKPDGKKQITFGAHSFKILAKQLDNIAKGAQITREELIKQIQNIEIAIRKQKIGSFIPLNLALGGPDTYRSIAKSALVLWCYQYQTKESEYSNFSRIIEFINTIPTKEEMSRDDSVCKIDSRKINPELLTNADKDFGTFFNILHVEADEGGNLRGVFRLYNICSWIIDFKCKTTTTNSSTSLISNSQDTSQWVIEKTNTNPLGKDWFTQPSYSLSEAKEAFGNMISSFWKDNNLRAQEAIIDEAMKDYFPGEGEVLEKEHIGLLSHDIAEEMVSRIFGTDRTKVISGEKAVERLREHLKSKYTK